MAVMTEHRRLRSAVPLKYIVLAFTLVTGMDSSSVLIMPAIIDELKKEGGCEAVSLTGLEQSERE